MKSMRGFRTMSGTPTILAKRTHLAFLNEINQAAPVAVTRGFGRTNPIGLGRIDPAKASAGGTPALRPGILAKRTDLVFPNEINQYARGHPSHRARIWQNKPIKVFCGARTHRHFLQNELAFSQ